MEPIKLRLRLIHSATCLSLGHMTSLLRPKFFLIYGCVVVRPESHLSASFQSGMLSHGVDWRFVCVLLKTEGRSQKVKRLLSISKVFVLNR